MDTKTAADGTAEQQQEHRTKGGRLVFLLPLLVLLGLGLLLAVGLTLNPREIPSPLIDKPVPDFKLPPVQGRVPGLSTADLQGEVSLVNVFASWCVACRDEHPLLMQLRAESVVPIHGLNYKDKPKDAAEWLDAMGDPYTRTGADIDGHVGIDWGVYGVPETFIIDRRGKIAYKHIGPIMPSHWNDTLLPIIQRLRRQQ
ncbi:MAG: DsbE family thiol:disulfide interchange protein [Acidiferrobacterales bacterium]